MKIRTIYKKGIGAFLFLIGIFFISTSYAEVNPYNYRKDFYRMPVWDRIEEKSLLETTLNTKLRQLVPQTPVEVKDREGNVVVISGGKRRYSISRDGTVTYYANNTKTHSRRLLRDDDGDDFKSGELYLFRTYQRENPSSGRFVVFNEWGEIVGYEVWGLDNKLLERQDHLGRPTYRYEYDDTGYWEHDLINDIWKRYEQEIPVEERRNSKEGEIIAHWEKGEFFGIRGLWRIERDWNGERVADVRWTLYDEFGKELYITYNADGAVIRRYTWVKHRLILEEDLQNFDYILHNDFGRFEEGVIWDGERFSRWEYHWEGSKLVDAINNYDDDVDFYDRRVYDLDNKVIRTERRDKRTGRLMVILNESIDFSEVEDLNVEELAEYFNIDIQLAQVLFEWIEEMRRRGKAGASLFGQLDFAEATLTLFDENNQPFSTLRLNMPTINRDIPDVVPADDRGSREFFLEDDLKKMKIDCYQPNL